ncbi:MAG: hypothetical protein BWK76_08280 [Desulfobulbaceae bacterium A2]|nr:MAG: hypothetical protein BWK76_08280 [Desulfobulbaceae bacterium A2]
MQRCIRCILAACVSALVLWLLLHLVGDSSARPELRQVLGRAILPLAAGYVVFFLVQTALRAQRSLVLLRAAGEAQVPPWRHIFLVTLARNMLVDLFPARAGELSYVALLNRGYQVGLAACLSSMSVALLFDIVALLALVLLLLPLINIRAVAGVLLVALVLTIIGCIVFFPLLRWVAARGWGGSFIHRLAEAFRQTREAGVVMPVALLSLGIRLGKYGALFCMFLAMALPSFPQLAAAPVGQVLLVLISSEAAASLPVPTLMSFGSYEAGGTAMWTALGLPAADAALCMLALHIGSQLVDYLLGGSGLLLVTLLAGRRNGTAAAVEKIN